MSVLLQPRLDVAALSEFPDAFADSLELELAGVLRAAGLRGRQAQAVASRLGWDGGGATTLAAAAARTGYTRERVRQLEARLRRHAARTRLRLPVTSSALRLVERAAPVARHRVPGILLRAGVSDGTFDVSGLFSAAELGRLEIRICERDGVVLRKRQAELSLVVGAAAQSLVKQNGAGSVDALTRRSHGTPSTGATRRLLEAQTDVIWLDESQEWFVVRGVKTPVGNALRKMLSISPSLTLAEADDGLRRGHHPIHLPAEVLLRLCESTPWLNVANGLGTITANVSLDAAQVLSPIEQTLVTIFRGEGPELTFSTASRLGAQHGLNPSSVGVYLCRSPVIKTISRGRYALRGSATAH